MTVFCLLCIMLATGIIGGAVNYFSDANQAEDPKDKTKKTKIRPLVVCALFGIAATLTVPFFLKLADSNLLDNIYLSGKCIANKDCSEEKFTHFKVIEKKDTSGKISKDTVKDQTDSLKINLKNNQKAGEEENRNTARDYLLWASYCLLAAAAGMRFIDFLINKMITAEKVKETVAENKKLREATAEQDKANKKRMANAKLQQAIAFQQEVNLEEVPEAGKREIIEAIRFSPASLPPITHADDPQKGRFGGKPHNNNRTLSVEYESYPVPLFLNIIIKVAAYNGSEMLNGEVYLFLHDSFAKQVVVLNANNAQFVEYIVPSYGAFTIGAVCDNGKTLLELDLAEVSSLPEDFRKR